MSFYGAILDEAAAAEKEGFRRERLVLFIDEGLYHEAVKQAEDADPTLLSSAYIKHDFENDKVTICDIEVQFHHQGANIPPGVYEKRGLEHLRNTALARQFTQDASEHPLIADRRRQDMDRVLKPWLLYKRMPKNIGADQ